MNRGKLIVLEGPNGSGKSTQSKKLLEKFEAAHLTAKIFNYPDISNSLISRSINRMKNNPDYDLSHASRVLLDAVTSSETMKTIDKALTEGIYCICESSYITTIVKYCFLKQIDNYEDIVSVMSFANMNVKPDLTIVFDAPPKVLIDRRSSNDTLSIEDLEKIRTGYLLEAKTHNYPIIFSTDSVESIADLVWSHVSKCLAVRISNSKDETDTKPTSVSDILNFKTESITQDLSIETNENVTVVDTLESSIESSKNFIDSVLNTSNNIYGFRDRLDIIPIAAALARSRGDDLDDLLIEEFDAQQEGNLKVFKKVIDHYGTDTIKQLSSHYLVIEGVSDLLIRKIESNLEGSYLEQPSHMIKEFFIPKELDEITKKEYKQTLNKIYTNHALIVDKLEKYLNKTNKPNKTEKHDNAVKAKEIAKNLLPVASKSSIALFASNQKIENLIQSLADDSLDESILTAKHLLSNMKQVEPVFFANLSNQKKKITETSVKDIIKQKTSIGFSSDFEAVSLVDFYPKNEIDLVPYMVYENSELSLGELRSQISKWSYADKNQVFESYINNHQKTGRVLETVKYSFDIACDYNIFRDFLNKKIVNNITWQDLTPRYGYEIPKIIEDADLIDKYEECFDLSLKLYSQMKLKNFHNQAQYVTLFGHRMRLQTTFSAKDSYSVLDNTNNLSIEYKNIISKMHEKLVETHPLIASLRVSSIDGTQETKKSNVNTSKQKSKRS